jgi:NAD(P)H-hydrate repair Nnr-like enzyme with NAD(P)H-hydrate epimerase domain
MSTMGRSTASAALAVAVLGFGMLGCGETVVDDVKTEDAIEQNLEQSAGKKVTAVDCPSGVEVEPDATFECTVSLAGGKEETATMKILDEDANIELTKLKGGK